MSHIYRCSRCRTRNTFRRAIGDYVRQRKCRDCGHGHFYIDRERVNRKPCHCSGYHYAHRPGSRCCESHPQVDAHRARRAGVDEIDITFLGLSRGAVGADCPF